VTIRSNGSESAVRGQIVDTSKKMIDAAADPQSRLGRVLGVAELAAFFQCSPEKIKRRARNGELPAFKFGKSWYVREDDLRRYIECAVGGKTA